MPRQQPTKPARKRATRRDWTRKLLRELARTGNIGHACKLAGINRDTFYTRRNNDPSFAAAAADALEQAIESLELNARRRAMKGSDVLTIFLLKAHRPGVYRERYDVRHTGRIETGEAATLTDDELARIARSITDGNTDGTAADNDTTDAGSGQATPGGQ